MIKGMTGFGTAQFSSNKIKGLVEVKSVNHRYLDEDFYLPTGLTVLENKMRPTIKKLIERGKVNVTVKIMQKPSQTITLNTLAIQQYIKFIKKVKKDFMLQENLTAEELMRFPGIIETKEIIIHPDEIWPVMEKALARALNGVLQMRKREGWSLARDIKAQINLMSLQLNKIQIRANQLLILKQKNSTPDEFISYQKNSDVHEEISRLKHYISEIRMLLSSDVAVGKKLDFIAQEMHRETNTIGSKLPDKIVSNSVISLKSNIEKLREQSQNIE